MSSLTKVLVLDDDVDDFNRLRDLFRKRRTISSRHFYLEHASTTDEARARLDVDNWHFLIIDYHLGNGETGLDFIHALHAEGRRYPALLLSGAIDISVHPTTVELIQQERLHFLPKEDLSWGALQHAIADKVSRRFRVLIVDDDPDDVTMFQESLRDDELTQFDVETANTLEQARARLAAATFDVMLLDFKLGPARGTDLLFDVPEEKIPASTILCTGYEHFHLDHRTLRLIGHGRLRFCSKNSLGGDGLMKAVLGSSRLVLWADSILPSWDTQPPCSALAGDGAANFQAQR